MQNRSTPRDGAPEEMSHPDSPTLAAFVYGEMEPAEENAVESHLRACGPCAGKVAELRSTMAALDAWRLAPASRSGFARGRGLGAGWVKWAAAAALVCGGFLAGQARSGPGQTEAELRALVAPEIERGRAETLKEMEAIVARRLEASLAEAEGRQRERLDELAGKLAGSRVADVEGLAALLREMEARRVADMAGLRRELETVAVMTEQSLAQTQRRLTTLASQQRQ